ncbi:MAG: DUF308 domain-containing protein [Paludibacteraceae bacterium]|nr:DUF308 domain-containing protein [Paludibacteraceae bacterium]
MENDFIKTVTHTIKHWYIPLIIGIMFIIIGIFCFVSPLTSYLTFSLIFSISFLFSGILEIVFSITNRKEIDNWGWTLAFGIITFIIGLLLVLNPRITMLSLPYFIGFLMLFRSIFAMSLAIDLKNYYVLNWGYLLAIAILGIIFSFILLLNPLFGGIAITLLLGFTFLASGCYSIYLSFELKRLKKYTDKIPDELKERYENIKREIQEKIWE